MCRGTRGSPSGRDEEKLATHICNPSREPLDPPEMQAEHSEHELELSTWQRNIVRAISLDYYLLYSHHFTHLRCFLCFVSPWVVLALVPSFLALPSFVSHWVGDPWHVYPINGALVEAARRAVLK